MHSCKEGLSKFLQPFKCEEGAWSKYPTSSSGMLLIPEFVQNFCSCYRTSAEDLGKRHSGLPRQHSFRRLYFTFVKILNCWFRFFPPPFCLLLFVPLECLEHVEECWIALCHFPFPRSLSWKQFAWQQISVCISFPVKFLSPCDKEFHGRQEEEEDSIHVKSLIAAGGRGAWWAPPDGILGRC